MLYIFSNSPIWVLCEYTVCLRSWVQSWLKCKNCLSYCVCYVEEICLVGSNKSMSSLCSLLLFKYRMKVLTLKVSLSGVEPSFYLEWEINKKAWILPKIEGFCLDRLSLAFFNRSILGAGNHWIMIFQLKWSSNLDNTPRLKQERCIMK